MTYNDLCDNGCPARRYASRKICLSCIGKETKEKRLAKNGGIDRARGRPRKDGNPERLDRLEKPLEGLNPLMARMARVSLRSV